VGVVYGATITGEGGTGAYQWSLSGALPLGLALEEEGTPSTSIAGVPSESGVFDFTVALVDSAGTRVEQALRLVISGEAIAIATLNLPAGLRGLRIRLDGFAR
jgi:hypothetical protein